MKRLIFLVFILFFGGCSYKIDLKEYTPINAPKAKYMPTKSEIEHKKLNVIVMKFDDNNINLAEKNHLSDLMTSYLKNSLIASKEVNVLDNFENMSLKDIIKKVQISKSLGINVADYVINGKIEDVTYNYQFHRGYVFKDKKGKYHRVPPSIDYKACVSGYINIYSLKEFRYVKTFYFSDCAKDFKYIESFNIVTYRPDLIRKAAINSLDYILTSLEDFFSPKGYIEEIRKKDDEFIVKVTMGSDDGLRPEDEVLIYNIRDVKNDLTNEVKKEAVVIGKGIVSDNEVSKHSAWIIVEDLKEGEILHIGDFVKLNRSGNSF